MLCLHEHEPNFLNKLSDPTVQFSFHDHSLRVGRKHNSCHGEHMHTHKRGVCDNHVDERDREAVEAR